MLKTEITFERILGTFAPGALFMFGLWYLHRPFFLKYFPNLVGGLVEKTNEAGTQLEQVGGVSVGAKLVMFVLVSFCIGIVVNQIADSAISLLFLDQDKTLKHSRVFYRRLKEALRILTLTHSRQDARFRVVESFLRSTRNRYFLKMVRSWTKSDRALLKKLGEEKPEWTAPLKNEAILIYHNIVARLEVMPGTPRQIFDEQHFSLNFIASLMMTFLLLLPVAVFSFVTSSVTESNVKVHYTITILAMIGAIYLGIVLCGLLLKRQFTKMCEHLLTTSFHLFLISTEGYGVKGASSEKSDKVVFETESTEEAGAM